MGGQHPTGWLTSPHGGLRIGKKGRWAEERESRDDGC